MDEASDGSPKLHQGVAKDRRISINEYTPDGQLIRSIGTSGTGLGQLQEPAGIRISQNSGDIYVADQFNNRIEVLDPNGKGLFTFGTPGTANG